MSSGDRFREQHVPAGEGRQLEYEIEIDAPRDAVWKALTDGPELERWFPFAARVEPGEGGQVWMSWDGQFEAENRIHVWEPERHLRTGWYEGGVSLPLAVDFHLEGDGGRTVLRLVHHGFGPDAAWDELYDGIRRGWAFELRCLRHYLERHRGSDRRVVRVRQAIAGSAASAWERLVSPAGLGLALTGRGLNGEPVRLATAPGDRFDGRLVFYSPPREMAVHVDGWNDALLRLAIERCGGPGSPLEAWLWLETWNEDAARLDALEQRFHQLLAAVTE